MEANKNKNLGNAGEFYVLAQLAQRGYIAGKTDDGQTLIDVIATHPATLNTVNIQVKTRTIDGRISSWLMSFKNEKAFEKLWYVVVEVGDIIEWNYAYFEVDTINENKLIGGNVEQNFDVVASAHMTRQSKLNIVERQR